MVVDYLNEAFISYERDHHEMMKRIACSQNARQISADEYYALSEAIEDARLGLQTEYVAKIKEGLGAENAARFELWLNDAKLSMTHVRFRRKEAAEYTYPDPVTREQNAKDNLDGLCRQLSLK